MVLLVALLAMTGLTTALENGLARTPPMGWLAWERSQNMFFNKEKDQSVFFYHNFVLKLTLKGFVATLTARTTRTTASANASSCKWQTCSSQTATMTLDTGGVRSQNPHFFQS